MIKNVLICAGGSGGHVFCATALCEHICSQNEAIDIDFITDVRGLRYVVDTKNCFVFPDLKVHFDRKCAKNYLTFIKNIFKISFSTLKILLTKKYDYVIGFGGVVTVIPIILCKILGVFSTTKIIIHEQNAVIGRANLFLLKFVDFITYAIDTLEVPEKFTPSFAKKKKFIRSPVRGKFFPKVYCNLFDATSNYLQNDQLNNSLNQKINILVFAGSQGADFFYNFVPFALTYLKCKKKIKITQQVKKEYIQKIKHLYDSSGIESDLREFIFNMDEELQNSHFVICRSGASTLAELSACACPALVIAYPYAADNHQLKNAQFFAKYCGVKYFEEKDLSTANFCATLEEILNSSCALNEMSEQMKKYDFISGAGDFWAFLLSLKISVGGKS